MKGCQIAPLFLSHNSQRAIFHTQWVNLNEKGVLCVADQADKKRSVLWVRVKPEREEEEEINLEFGMRSSYITIWHFILDLGDHLEFSACVRLKSEMQAEWIQNAQYSKGGEEGLGPIY